MPAKPKPLCKKMTSDDKQALNAISGEQALEQSVQQNVPPSSLELGDPSELQERRALALGDYSLALEKAHHRFMRKLVARHDRMMKGMEALLAQMQAMPAMREIYQQASQRLQEGWTPGLSREQAEVLLTKKYSEELFARLQNLLNQTANDWQKLRLPYIELLKWSKLPDREKEKWLELYSQPRPRTNLIAGGDYASRTQKHSQTNA